MRILVTAAGAGPGVALIKAIRRMGGFALGVDGREQASGLYLADAHATVPMARDPEYIPTLIGLCKEHNVGMVVPILDVETPHVAQARERLAEEWIHAAVNPLQCLELSNDKVRSYETCEAAGIGQPQRFASPAEAPADAFPLIGKPFRGVGARGIVKLENKDDVVPDDEERLWQCFIQGDEFSIDTWGDPTTDQFVAVPRHRREVRAGQMVQGDTRNDADLLDFARKACTAFGVKDVSCVQVIRGADGKLYFVEMNPRYGTGISLSIAAGIAFPRLQWLAHYEPDAIIPEMLQFEAGVEMLRYWEEVYRRGDNAFGRDVP